MNYILRCVVYICMFFFTICNCVLSIVYNKLILIDGCSGVVGLNTVQTVLLICGVVAAALTVVAVAIIIYASAR